jgi:hypothetical protein
VISFSSFLAFFIDALLNSCLASPTSDETRRSGGENAEKNISLRTPANQPTTTTIEPRQELTSFVCKTAA